ncbi:MAG: PEP-CTERM sorting domain-containing protein [Verrucomicrobiae bacterium]|nr:PEP-CTERM sorting domain-containing protein [Verrucomicrobiae bacterium]
MTALLICPPLAHAATYIFNFECVFAGPPPASSEKPWVVAAVEDLAGGGVRMTIQNSVALGDQVVEKIWLNLNPVLDPRSLVFRFVGSSGGFNLPVVAGARDKFSAQNSGKYDVLFVFDAPWGRPEHYLPACFSAGDWIIYDVTGIPGLTAGDFWYTSTPTGNAGPFYAAAYIPCSTYICVPEPTNLAIFGMAGCAWLIRRVRRR